MFNNNNSQNSENGASLIGEGLNVEGEIYADDIVIGKTATIKGDIFFKDNLKIDEGADVDGYIKRVNQGKSSSSSPKQPTKSQKDKKDKQLEIEDSAKKAVNQS